MRVKMSENLMRFHPCSTSPYCCAVPLVIQLTQKARGEGNVIIFGNEYTAAAWPQPCFVPIVVIVAFPRVIVPDK